MKAICVREFGGPEVLKLEDIPEPRPPQSGEVLVSVKAAGVNPYDTYMRAGAYGARNPALPYTPGSDATGVVESAGADVNLKAGERVYTSGMMIGAYAEFMLCKSSQVQTLPARLNFSQGAEVFVPYATAYRALFHVARTKPGETLLVHGTSGGVGLAAIQFGVAAGTKIIATAGSDEGLKLIKTEGAQHTLNHSSNDYQKQVLDVTNGRGVDVIVEMLANVNLGHDLKMLSPRGRVVVGSRGSVEINPATS